MAYTGRAPSAAPLTSADINDGAVAPADLSTGAPSWTAGGAVTLPYNGSNKLATTSTGIDVTGTVTADGLTVDASNTATVTSSKSNGWSLNIQNTDATDSNGLLVGTNMSGGSRTVARFEHGAGRALWIQDNGDISFYEDTGTTPKLFWDASAESLGIGTSSPAAPLHIYNADAKIRLQNSGSTGIAEIYTSNQAGLVLDADPNNTDSGTPIAFKTDGTERMRIDSSGSQWVGATSLSDLQTTGGAGFWNDGAYGRRSLALAHTSATSRDIAVFYGNSSLAGTISCSPTATAYNTSSDYRLKEDWQPMSGSIDRLKNLKPVNFAWKADGSRVDGFLAHEAAEVVPEAVTGEKDAVEAIGNVTDAEGAVVQENVPEPAELAEGQTWTKTEDRPVYQGIDQAKLVPLLTAALQEAVSKIEALETRIAALEV